MTNNFTQILKDELEQGIGENVTLILLGGKEVSGLIAQVGDDYVMLKKPGGRTTTIALNGISMLEFPEEGRDESARIENGAHPPLPPQITRPLDTSSPIPPPLPRLGTDVLKRFEELVARLDHKIVNSRLSPIAPSPREASDELKLLGRRDVLGEWARIKNSYESAVKIREANSRYGHMRKIISYVEELIEKVPHARVLKRHLVYFLYLDDQIGRALEEAEELAADTQASQDWLTVAALAIIEGSEMIACDALAKVFLAQSLMEHSDAWYMFVSLIRSTASYTLLYDVVQAGNALSSELEEWPCLDSCLYLLKDAGKEAVALDILRRANPGGAAVRALIAEAVNWLVGQMGYENHRMMQQYRAAQEAAMQELSVARQAEAAVMPDPGSEEERKPVALSSQQMKGYIYTYKIGRNFGFLFGTDGGSYFFHRSAILDEDLLERLESLDEPNLRPSDHIPVTFEITQGAKGPLAVGLSLYRKTEEILALAEQYANAGEYAKAVTQVRAVLARDPEYRGAQEAYERWNQYAQVARTVSVPGGDSPFARGKRAVMIEKDTEKAIHLFQLAIEKRDNVEPSVKELVLLLGRSGRSQEAIDLLEHHRQHMSDQQSLDNLLIDIYQRAGQYDRALALLERVLGRATTKERRAHILWQMANCHLQQDHYAQAEQRYREVLSLGQERRAAKKQIALCLIKQQKYDEAERLLNEILDIASDTQAVELLEEIKRVKASGQSASARIDEIITETRLSGFSSEISAFTRFFLERCKYTGVRPERVQQKKLDRTDVRRLDDLATQLGMRNPRERAEYYLSAARIISEAEDWDDPRQIYKYLYRSFASHGDAAVLENKPLDAAREWYCEALTMYDGERSRNREEQESGGRDKQDAVNALVRYLYSTLGAVPTSPNIPGIDETLEEVLRLSLEKNRLFDQITYLLMRSRYAAQRVLTRLYSRPTLRATSLQYLQHNDIVVSGEMGSQEGFMQLWNDLRRKRFEEVRAISAELGMIARADMSVAALENSLRGLERIKVAGEHLLFDLDQQRLRQLRQVLEILIDLGREQTFEEQERYCALAQTSCQDLLRDIEDSPTRLSVEELYPIIETLSEKTAERLEHIYSRSVPQVALRLPEGMEWYSPETGHIEVQVVVTNRLGCSPAEALELVPQEDEDFFQVEDAGRAIRLDSSLRGGDQKILYIPLRLTEQARRSEAFSLPVYAQYRTRSGETVPTPVANFSIRLYAGGQFERIENPYATYANGSTVENRDMFFGRDEMITNIANAIRSTRAESKSVVIYGQKRAGKSSILYHLKEQLKQDPNLLVLDIGNIGSLLDIKSARFLYQVLWSILRELQWAIEDEQYERGRSALELAFPTDLEFFAHPSPLTFFQDIFERFKRVIARTDSWRDARVVLLIDEFSYIYSQILNGRIEHEFMKIWKALLQRNFFSCVLVGQDTMPRFKQAFPNEFGTSQDVRVTYLATRDAIRLIDEPLRIGGKNGESRFREKAIDRVVDLSAGNPFYIQIICNRLVDYMNEKHARLVTEADIEQVKEQLVRGEHRLAWEDFDNLLSSGDLPEQTAMIDDAKKVLTAIAINTRLGSCDRESITSSVSETRASIDEILDDLVTRDVIEIENRRNYRIRVSLFKEWLLAQS